MNTDRGRFDSAWASLPVELVLGAIFFAYGLQKLASPGSFGTDVLAPLRIPPYLAYVATAAELGGAILLLTGLFVRLGSVGHFVVQAVAIALLHWQNGLLGPGGFELPLALLTAALVLLVLGPDPLSIDRNILAPIWRKNGVTGFNGRENITLSGGGVKAAAAMMMVAGIAIPVVRIRLGIPEGIHGLIATVIPAFVSVVSGSLVILERRWSYAPAFVLGRLSLGASALMLFCLKYTVRGAAALLLSLVIVLGLRSARRGKG